MQRLSKKLKVQLYATFILTGLAVLLLAVSIFTGIDNSGYIKPSPIYSLVKALGFVFTALAIVSIFTIPKGALSGDSPLTLPVIFPSALFAIVMFIGGISFLGLFTPITNFFSGFANSRTVITVLAAVFSILSVVYFVFNCFPHDGMLKQTHALIGFSVPIASLLWIAISYFNMSVSMNTPIKTFSHLTLIAFLIWSGYEIRSMVEKSMPRIYFCTGLIVIFFSGVSSLPWLFGYIFGSFSDPAYPSYLLYNFISLAIFAYSSVRVTVFVLARDLFERIADQTPPELPDDEAEENELNESDDHEA